LDAGELHRRKHLISLFTACSSVLSHTDNELYWEAIWLRISFAENFGSPKWNFRTMFPPVHGLMLDGTDKQTDRWKYRREQ